MWYQKVLFYIKPSEILCIFCQTVQVVYFHAMQNKVLFILLHGDTPHI